MKHTGTLLKTVCLLLSVLFLASSLFACGKKEATKTEFTITFDANGGTAIKPVTAAKGTTVDLPTPKRAEHKFKSWYLGDTEVSSPYTVESDVTLRAEWETEDTNEYYTVHFDTDGGSYVSDVQVMKGKLFELPTEPTKSGYTFEYWEDEDGTRYEADAILDIEGDELNLRAVWAEDEETTEEDSTEETTEETTEAPETTKKQTETTKRETTRAVTTKAPETTAVVAPEITGQPKSAEFDTGATVKLTVTAKGTNLKYQWYLGENALAGATSATLELKDLKVANDGQTYCCSVSNTAGSVKSSAAKLTYAPAKPIIATQPVAQNFDVNEILTFTIKAYGKGLTYQWYRNDKVLDKATSATYTTTEMKESDNGAKFKCIVTDSAKNTVSSSEVAVTFVAAAPKFTVHPKDTLYTEGGSATFTVKVTGAGAIYTWYVDGNVVEGAVTNTLKLDKLTEEYDGKQVYCSVYSTKFTTPVISNKATLTSEQVVPKITKQPEDVSYLEGETINISVEATGGKLTYEWWTKSPKTNSQSKVISATSDKPTLVLSRYRPADTGTVYYCKIRNSKGEVASKAITVTYIGEPIVSSVKTTYNGNTAVITKTGELVIDKKLDTYEIAIDAIGGKLTYTWYVNAGDGTRRNLPYDTDSVSITDKNDYGKKYTVCCDLKSDKSDTIVTFEVTVSLKSEETTTVETTTTPEST